MKMQKRFHCYVMLMFAWCNVGVLQSQDKVPFKMPENRVAGYESGDCELDVSCPIGRDFKLPAKSTVLIEIVGEGFCTGTILNNTKNDFKQYILTAAHCVSTQEGASKVKIYFNYESQKADCGTTNASGIGKYDSTILVKGAKLRALVRTADLALLECLDTFPMHTCPIYFSGWNRVKEKKFQAIGIHHPKADLKKISKDKDTINMVANNWVVIPDSGSFEAGSSGCGLFTTQGLFIGALSGGVVGCQNAPNSDKPIKGNAFFGRLDAAWDGLADSVRLRDWLDPLGTSQTTWNGLYNGGNLYANNNRIFSEATSLCFQPDLHQLTVRSNFLINQIQIYSISGKLMDSYILTPREYHSVSLNSSILKERQLVIRINNKICKLIINEK